MPTGPKRKTALNPNWKHVNTGNFLFHLLNYLCSCHLIFCERGQIFRAQTFNPLHHTLHQTNRSAVFCSTLVKRFHSLSPTPPVRPCRTTRSSASRSTLCWKCWHRTTWTSSPVWSLTSSCTSCLRYQKGSLRSVRRAEVKVWSEGVCTSWLLLHLCVCAFQIRWCARAAAPVWTT